MISENMTKQDFILKALQRDVQNIYNASLKIAKQNIRLEGKALKQVRRSGPTIGVRSGSLLESLQNPDYLIQAQGDKFIVNAYIVKHMRFLDMKKHGNWKIYNRQVWGILYNNALRDIRYGYGKEISDSVGEALKQAFGPEHGKSTGKSTGNKNKNDNSFSAEAYRKAKGR